MSIFSALGVRWRLGRKLRGNCLHQRPLAFESLEGRRLKDGAGLAAGPIAPGAVPWTGNPTEVDVQMSADTQETETVAAEASSVLRKPVVIDGVAYISGPSQTGNLVITKVTAIPDVLPPDEIVDDGPMPQSKLYELPTLVGASAANVDSVFSVVGAGSNPNDFGPVFSFYIPPRIDHAVLTLDVWEHA